MKKDIENKIDKLQELASKMNLYLLYSLVLPFLVLTIGILFGFDVVAAIGFWTMLGVFFIYIIAIQLLYYKVKKHMDIFVKKRREATQKRIDKIFEDEQQQYDKKH
jgi:hypothetical protein